MRIRLASHSGIFNFACRFALHGFWATHVDAVMPDGRWIGAMGDGVKIRPAGFDAATVTRQEFVDIPATQEQDDIFYAFLESQVGKPYDFWAIGAFFYPWRDWADPDRWFCSELIEVSFVECGTFPERLAIEKSRFTPSDLDLCVGMLTGGG